MAKALFTPVAAALAVAVISACTSTPAVSADTPRADLILRASGAGDWSVRCEAETARGRTAIAELDGRGSADSDVIVINDAVNGSCSYATGTAQLTLTLEGGMACPFTNSEAGLCRVTLPSSETGSFDLTPQ